ncbi:MAG: hypothetical protein SPF92_01030, partial [Clostridia bacterium]|nr:hypothetical protein [Clostridia bacterium]
MDEYKWNNDDYQNASVNGEENKTVENTDCFSTLVTTPKKKKTKKKISMPIFIFSLIFAMIISTSAYALLAPSVSQLVKEFKIKANSNIGTSEQKVLDNISSANPTNTVANKTKLEIPDIAEKVGPAVVGVINMTTYSGYSYNDPYGFFFGQGDNS